jgi:hypothetical protein
VVDKVDRRCRIVFAESVLEMESRLAGSIDDQRRLSVVSTLAAVVER